MKKLLYISILLVFCMALTPFPPQERAITLLESNKLFGDAWEELRMYLQAADPAQGAGTVYQITSVSTSASGDLTISLAAGELREGYKILVFDDISWIGVVELAFGDAVTTPYATLRPITLNPAEKLAKVEINPTPKKITIPEGVSADSAMQFPAVDPGYQGGGGVPAADASYPGDVLDFPWKQGYFAQYGALGYHQACFQSLPMWGGAICGSIDFFTDGNEAESRAPKEAYAATDGYVEWACEGPKNNSYFIGGYLYTHLAPDTDLTEGTDYFNRNDYIGDLATETVILAYEDSCGHLFQRPGQAHLHFGFPEQNMYNPITIEGYLLLEDTSADQNGYIWTDGNTCTVDPVQQGGDKCGINAWLRADWPGGAVTPPGLEGTIDFFDGVLATMMNLMDSVLGVFPEHNVNMLAALNIGDTVITMVANVLTTFYFVVFYAVDLRFVMAMFGIMLTIETVRMVVSLVTDFMVFVKGLPLM